MKRKKKKPAYPNVNSITTTAKNRTKNKMCIELHWNYV